MDVQFLRITSRIVYFVSHGDDGTGFCENRDGIDIPVHGKYTAASVFPSCKYIIVDSVRQPYLYFCRIQFRYAGRSDRDRDHFTSEEIFIGYMVSRFFFRPSVVHREHQRNILLVCTVIHCVQIRNEAVAEP